MRRLSDYLEEKIKGNRNVWGYHEEFDIVLAAPFDEEGAEGHFREYDNIGSIANKFGKRIFLPHREIKSDWPSQKVADVPLTIVTPKADLAIIYPACPSHALAYCWEPSVRCLKVPVILFQREGTPTGYPFYRNDIQDMIEFERFDEGLSRLALSIKEFYLQQLAQY